MKFQWSGILFVVLGIIVIALSSLLPFCPKLEDMEMTCHLSQFADKITGIVILGLGIASFVFPQKIVRGFIALEVFVASVLVSLFPTVILGTCGHVHMRCHAIAAPVLLLTGVIFALISLVVAIVLLRGARNESKHD
ncbi:MAG: DUF4418 family protein [Fibrobacter sp.]|nr:DUF4418 family protein [Fibrobacter sp.]